MSPKKRRKKKTYYAKKGKGPVAGPQRSLLVVVSLLVAGAVLVGLFYLFSYVGSLFFSRNPAFVLKNVEITTDGRLPVSELKRLAGVSEGDNLFSIDFDEVRAKLLSKPQVEAVSIQRRAPSTLVIYVVERTAVVQVRFKRWGLIYLLDRHGVSMRPPANSDSYKALPIIEGLRVKEPKLGEKIDDIGVKYVLELVSAIDDLGLSSQLRFKRFNLSSSDHVNAILENGVTARFPRHSASNKLIRLAATLQLAQERGQTVRTVDLVPDGPNTPTF